MAGGIRCFRVWPADRAADREELSAERRMLFGDTARLFCGQYAQAEPLQRPRSHLQGEAIG